jgi:hypothetical protein
MDHDLRHDPDETQHHLPAVAVPAKPTAAPDDAAGMQAIDHRLRVLEAAVNRIADHVQVLILRLDDGK